MHPLLVSHPHAAQVSNETAAALVRQGLLAGYVTGLAGARDSWMGGALQAAARHLPALSNRIVDGVGAERLHALTPVELGSRAVGALAARLGVRSFRTYDALFVGHDAAVSILPWPSGAGGIYAYEDGALRTFCRARGRGLARILDLPTPWWRTAAGIWREESERWPGAMGALPPAEPPWKLRRKDEELAMASAISVASQFTRSSVEVLAGDRRVIVCPYGFPVDHFAPRARAPEGRFTVLAVGNQDLRKGTPYLLEAWRRAGLKEATLRIVGRMRLTPAFLARYAGLFEHVPWMPRSRLAQVYQDADLLAFPTLGDGFGLVMQEAMCCGTPVLTTPCGGGPECIETGKTGLIVPARNVDALVEALRWGAAHRDDLAEMGRRARRRAEAWTWIEAGARLVQLLKELPQ